MNKDILIYVKNNEALGYLNAKLMTSYLVNGTVYKNRLLYHDI